MHFSCSAQALIEGLTTATYVLATRTPQQILEGVLLRATDSGVEITGSDGAISARTTVDAVIAEPGDVVLPGRLLLDVARKMPDAELDITVKGDQQAILRCHGVRMTLSGQKGSLYPALPLVSAENAITLPQKLLKEMLSQTAFAIATDNPRKVLNGALLEISRGEARVVALDGFRLAMRKCLVSEETRETRAILPGKSVGELVKMLSDSDKDMATLLVGGAQMRVDMGKTQFYTTLIEGEYIDYRAIMPKSFQTTATFDKDALQAACERNALIARGNKSNLIFMSFHDNLLALSANTENADAYGEMDVSLDGAPLDIAFNVLYVLDILRVMPSGAACFRFNNQISPCLVVPESGDTFCYLMLPVRVAV